MSKENILIKEEEFHDKWAENIDLDSLHVTEYFEVCTVPENRYLIKKMGLLQDKRILELGCGSGEASIYFAKHGALSTATDISGGMLEVVKKLAAKHEVKVETKKSASYPLDFPDDHFDFVYAANVLHHVDLEPSLIEIHRVLKPGGSLISWDPLDHNPIINVYRRMAGEVRTEDEHPIRMSELKLFRNLFKRIEYETFWFATLWIFLRFYLIERVNPNDERYWKKIIREHKRLEKLYFRLEKIDKKILSIFPFLKRYCWNIAIISTK